uniref:TIR domain-containing protein n=1 Tax=Megaselia scalaris TaxID=36166 RepID=T1GP82_MEGSC
MSVEIPSGKKGPWFWGLPGLGIVTILAIFQKLDLSEVELTGIETIKSGYFKSLKNIESITINFADIRKLPEKLFFETCNLKSLYLYSNELEQLPEKLFKSLDKLLVLSLGNNKLRSLHENLFKPLISIENIDLSRNQLNTLNFKSFFEGLYKDGRSLIYNDQEYILSHGGGKRILDLTDNDVISSFHPKELNEDLKSFNITNRWQLKFGLENIDCYCQMYDINLFALSATAFQNLKFLEIDFIKCKNPTKKYLQYYIDSDFKSLIDPSECPGKCTESENRADCSNRGLTEIPRTLNTYYNQNECSYILIGNDWKCDCDNLTFIDLIRNTSQIRDEVKCLANEKYVISTKFDDDQIQEICTESSSGNIIIGLVLGIIFLTTILVTVSFKKELRIWLFAHRICLCWISEEEVDKNRKYDAFICFSEKDEYFVQQIVQELESGPNPYKLCLHFRDWLVGEYISKQIVTSVEDSRRSIFIITNNFLSSMWSRLEFRSACAASLREPIPRIIVILCEEIDELGKLDPEIKAYFNSNTYLKWDDNRFWSRLRYALPHRKSTISNDIELEELKLDS